MLIVDMPMPITGEMQVCIRSDGYVLFPDDDVPFFKVTKARELVRCGECEYHGEPHRTDMGVDVVWCNFYNTHKLKDGYCNCGERKDGEHGEQAYASQKSRCPAETISRK